MRARTAILACALAGVASAQEQRPEEPPTRANKDALAGPRVSEKDRPSIVRRNIYGELQRPEETPEEAAVRELGLDPTASAAAEKVFLRRLRWIDQWVADNAELLVRLKRASDATTRGERVVLALEAIAAVEPLTHQISLWEQVRSALPATVASEFDHVMTEYWDALAADGRRRPPGVIERFAIVSKERLAILGREIERSLETLGDSGRLAVAALTGGLDLSESQRTQLAAMAADYDQKSEMPPSGDQKRALVIRVLSILSPEQRERVMAMLKGS